MGEWYAQMYTMQKGLKHFGKKGKKATIPEVTQMHDCMCFKALVVKELARRGRESAQEGLLFLI